MSLFFHCQSSRYRNQCSGEGTSSSKGEAGLRKPHFEEDKDGFLGQVGSDLRGSSVTHLPSNPKIRGKGVNFKGNCEMSVVENMEVFLSSPSQSPESSSLPSCGLALPLPSPSGLDLPSSISHSQSPMENRVISKIFSKKDVGTFYQKYVGNPIRDEVEAQFAYSNQLSEGFNPSKSKPNLPKEVSNLVSVSQGDTVVSPSGEFQLDGLSPRKMAKVREVLSFLDIKVYSRRKSRCSTGM